MNTRTLITGVDVLAGLASGKYAIESAAASQPPIDWQSLAFLFFGTLVALPAVLGFQVLLGNSRALRWGFRLFTVCAIYLASAGVAALVMAVLGAGFSPHSFLFLLLGLAMLVGLGIVRALFSARLANGA